MRAQWQIDQGKRCGCGGSDEYCPCQNVSPEQRDRLRKASPEMQKHVVFVRQEIVGGFKPFFFALLPIAKQFAEETGGTLFSQAA